MPQCLACAIHYSIGKASHFPQYIAATEPCFGKIRSQRDGMIVGGDRLVIALEFAQDVAATETGFSQTRIALERLIVSGDRVIRTLAPKPVLCMDGVETRSGRKLIAGYVQWRVEVPGTADTLKVSLSAAEGSCSASPIGPAPPAAELQLAVKDGLDPITWERDQGSQDRIVDLQTQDHEIGNNPLDVRIGTRGRFHDDDVVVARVGERFEHALVRLPADDHHLSQGARRWSDRGPGTHEGRRDASTWDVGHHGYFSVAGFRCPGCVPVASVQLLVRPGAGLWSLPMPNC